MPAKRNLTQGSIPKGLLAFALPLILGNFLQQCYNLADTWVVGRFIGEGALAAVGSSYTLMTFLTSILLGLCMGSSVYFSIQYGRKDPDKLRNGIFQSFLLIAVLTLLLNLLVYLLLDQILVLLQIPADVTDLTRVYLQWVFGGIAATFLYNYFANLLRAVGNSVTPLLFLGLSVVLNIGLDLLFVIRFHMGVAGVAWATIIAQAVSAVLVLAVLMRTDSCVRVELRRLRVHWDMLKKIVRVGIPAALQMAVTAFSNVFVQSYINHFGADCMSGWTAYTKIDQLMFLPMQSLALSATTFVGQNLGAGDTPRAQQGVRRALGISLAVTAVLMVPVLVFAPQLTAFFNRKAEVVAYGTLLLRYISPFYLLCCINQIYSGALRGAGNSQVPMVIMLGSFVVFRQIYLYIVSHFITNTLLPLAMGYPAGWLVCSAATLLYYRRAALGRQRLVEDN